MFESITKNLSNAFDSIRIGGKLTEKNIRDGLGQVRQALLEADVSYDVAKDFVDTVIAQSVGDKVLKALDPTEQIVGAHRFADFICAVGLRTLLRRDRHNQAPPCVRDRKRSDP